MSDSDEKFRNRFRAASDMSPDGSVHLISCDVEGCGEIQPYPGPEETRDKRAFADGWIEDANGDAACPSCATAARAGAS